jgi:hypothetical protein
MQVCHCKHCIDDVCITAGKLPNAVGLHEVLLNRIQMGPLYWSIMIHYTLYYSWIYITNIHIHTIKITNINCLRFTTQQFILSFINPFLVSTGSQVPYRCEGLHDGCLECWCCMKNHTWDLRAKTKPIWFWVFWPLFGYLELMEWFVGVIKVFMRFSWVEIVEIIFLIIWEKNKR